jgi:hypothetical protein
LTPVDDWRPDKVKQMGEDKGNEFFLFILITGGALSITDGALSNELLSGVISFIALFVFLGFAAGLGENKNEIVQQEWELSDDSKLFEQRMNMQKLLEVKNLERKQLENDLAIYTSEWSKKAISERDVTISEQRRTIQQIDDEIKLISSNIADIQTKITTDMERIGEIMKSIEHLIPPP